MKYTCYGYCKNDEGRVVDCNHKEISINQICSNCGEFKTDSVGEVIYKGKYFFVIQCRNYAEAFLNIDIVNGDYIVEARERRRKVAGQKNRE